MAPDTQKGLLRIGALVAGIGTLGLITWVGTAPKGIDDGVGYVESTETSSARYESGSAAVVYREVKTRGEPCNSYEASPYAVEAMIDEMVNRGWKPPTQQEALASTQPRRGTPVTAVDPSAPVPIAAPRQSAPVDSAEPQDNGEPADSPDAPPVTTAPVEPPAPAEPAPKAPA